MGVFEVRGVYECVFADGVEAHRVLQDGVAQLLKEGDIGVLENGILDVFRKCGNFAEG